MENKFSHFSQTMAAASSTETTQELFSGEGKERGPTIADVEGIAGGGGSVFYKQKKFVLARAHGP